jgi:hypothetical protein
LPLEGRGGASRGTRVRCDKLHVYYAGHDWTLISAVVLPLGEIGRDREIEKERVRGREKEREKEEEEEEVLLTAYNK